MIVYNAAVDDLSNLYDSIMHARETEIDLNASLQKAKQVQQELNTSLQEVRSKIKEMDADVERARNRLLLSKTKMQQVNIVTQNLSKLRPITQGTQVEEGEMGGVGNVPGNIEATGVQPQNIISIPDDEADLAVRAMLQSQNVEGEPANPNILQGVGEGYVGILPQGVISTGLIRIPTTTTTITTGASTVGTSTGSTLVAGTSGVVSNKQQKGEVDVIVVTESDIPEGFKKTKWENTLEKTNLTKPSSGQKAPKCFFCQKCMDRGMETGYTKCNDLSIHLESCGLAKKKKHKCTYEGCKASYVRFDNLKQHVSKEHTKQYLYTCKKCNKGFYTSPEATVHRKICYTAKPADDHMEEDIPKDDEDDNGGDGNGGKGDDGGGGKGGKGDDGGDGKGDNGSDGVGGKDT